MLFVRNSSLQRRPGVAAVAAVGCLNFEQG
jgi:hypothetical protein